jgi:DNA polymerase III epsilon subunit-like protein
LAWILANEDGFPVEEFKTILRPSVFLIPAAAAAIHGISTEVAMAKGVDLVEVMNHFQRSLLKANKVIAHNLQFDEMILGAEFIRCQLPNQIEALSRACTMQASTDLCQLPGPHGYKWPRLDELHQHLFGVGIGDAHRVATSVLRRTVETANLSLKGGAFCCFQDLVGTSARGLSQWHDSCQSCSAYWWLQG